jgi:predicted phosphodiesterase
VAAAAGFARAVEARRFAVISDIHANLHALDSVLDAIDALGVASVVCLGDIVGYGPHPAECCARLRERGIPSLQGNHDAYVVESPDDQFLHPDAEAGIAYARRHLDAAEIAALADLPGAIATPEVCFVHAAYPVPWAWDYLVTATDARVNLDTQPARLCFFGHTHVAGGFQRAGDTVRRVPAGPAVPIDDRSPLCLNPGAVGQPRDRDLRAAFLICDLDERRVHFGRVEYDIASAAKDALRAGLPPSIARRLRTGR